MQCLKIQPIGTVCSTPSCNGFTMAKYYCSICKFFDDERYMNLKLSYMRFLAFSWRREKKKRTYWNEEFICSGYFIAELYIIARLAIYAV